MTAGAGISHSERFDGMRTHGGQMDGIQAWVALPEANEEDAPSFAHFDATSLPALRTAAFRHGSSPADRIEPANADWLAGRIDLPPMDDQEFIPPPAAPKPSPEPMS